MSSGRVFYTIFSKLRLGTTINVKPISSDFEAISQCKFSTSKGNNVFSQNIKRSCESYSKKTHFRLFLMRLIVYIGLPVLYVWNKLKDAFFYLFFIKSGLLEAIHNNLASQSWLNILIYFFFLPYFWIINRKKLNKPSLSQGFSEKYNNFESIYEPINIQSLMQPKALKTKHSVSFNDKDMVRNSVHTTLCNKDTINKNNIKSPVSSSITLDITFWSDFSCQSIPRPLFPKTLIPKTLILDLDETLIHSLVKGGRITSGHMVEVMLGKHAILYYVHKRPHCDSFLRKVSKWYNVVIFTASVQEYADPVIDWLEQDRKLFKARFYRQHCTFRNGAYIKDLSIVQPDLSKAIIIDNSPVSYSMHENNAIPIQGWINDPSDKNLLHLIPFLHGLRYVLDVRALLGLRTSIFSLNS
ncbi:hypothetical protein PORY_000105 [Pneumocystis oryctolagi]|uniref:Uncharacterized protein n=1 Tax=Pneumocystis oryctolagi TaxID=42067 RepID=A0ACB7CH89_9ASCO|nr:hypothetical protein PORY_000105 [Pneumocystis oryctolagi]